MIMCNIVMHIYIYIYIQCTLYMYIYTQYASIIVNISLSLSLSIYISLSLYIYIYIFILERSSSLLDSIDDAQHAAYTPSARNHHTCCICAACAWHRKLVDVPQQELGQARVLPRPAGRHSDPTEAPRIFGEAEGHLLQRWRACLAHVSPGTGPYTGWGIREMGGGQGACWESRGLYRSMLRLAQDFG